MAVAKTSGTLYYNISPDDDVSPPSVGTILILFFRRSVGTYATVPTCRKTFRTPPGLYRGVRTGCFEYVTNRAVV